MRDNFETSTTTWSFLAQETVTATSDTCTAIVQDAYRRDEDYFGNPFISSLRIQGGRLALSLLLFFGPLFSQGSGHRMCINNVCFPRNHSMEKERAQHRKCSCLLWARFMKNAPSSIKCVIQQQGFALFTPTQNTDSRHISVPQPQVLQDTSVCTYFRYRVLSAQDLFAIEKMATAGMGNKKIATTLGLPQSTTKRWLQKLTDRTVPLTDTAQNTSFCTSFNTMAFHTDTHSTTETDNTLVCPKWASLILKCAAGPPKKFVTAPLGPFFCWVFNVPKVVGNSVKMREAQFEKQITFL